MSDVYIIIYCIAILCANVLLQFSLEEKKNLVYFFLKQSIIIFDVYLNRHIDRRFSFREKFCQINRSH
jgi:hypothetical protein